MTVTQEVDRKSYAHLVTPSTQRKSNLSHFMFPLARHEQLVLCRCRDTALVKAILFFFLGLL
jgi:hypothetical protein